MNHTISVEIVSRSGRIPTGDYTYENVVYRDEGELYVQYSLYATGRSGEEFLMNRFTTRLPVKES